MNRRHFFLLITLLVFGMAVLYQLWPEPSLPAGARADKILVKKSEKQMLLLYKNKILKTYQISIGKNQKGHKQKRGDRRTPEGKYRVDWKNPRSKYYLALHISYPNKTDRERALAKGFDPGGDIMIHGLPAYVIFFGRLHRLFGFTQGCIMVTNKEMDEIWRAVPVGTSVEIRP